jgi:hypothetical protein
VRGSQSPCESKLGLEGFLSEETSEVRLALSKMNAQFVKYLPSAELAP